MKKFTCFFYILFFLACKTYPQWSTDPNSNLVVAIGWDPHIASDSSGGCYISYNYENLSYPQKLAVERLDKYGYKPWGDKKQILGELPEQWHAEIIEDGEGGVIVSYEDNEVIWPQYNTRVRVQRIDSAGNFLWGQTGARVNIAEKMHGAQKLVSDGDGGCVVLWQDSLAQYSINRIDRYGQRVWGDSGIVIGSGQSSMIIRASDGNFYVQIRRNLYRISQYGQIIRRDSVTLGSPVADSEGGVILSGKTGTINNVKLVAQRKDSLGNNLWQEPYIEIADSLFINSQISIRYNTNYYFGWTSNKNGVESIPNMQGLRFDGTELFSNGGIQLGDTSTTITSFIPIIPSDYISNIYIWTQWINQQSSTGNFAKRIDTNSTQVWGDSAVLLNTPALRYLGITTDCFGGAIGTGYLNEDFAIRVFKISANGKLGEIITSVNTDHNNLIDSELSLGQNFPNPFNSSTNISYQITNAGSIKILLYNVLGEQIKTLLDKYKNAGIYSISFNANDIPSGVYIYTLETDNQLLTKKLTIIK